MGAFSRIGIDRVHWECWSSCNLGCEFCFRTISAPVSGRDAERLVEVVAASGARVLVFAGGDPSLRQDLSSLCKLAKTLGLTVEIQTNAHSQRKRLHRACEFADSIALSLDAGDPAVHDKIRKRSGNFDRVIQFISELSGSPIQVRVRTVITAEGVPSLPDLGKRLAAATNVVEWGLQELTLVGAARQGGRVASDADLPFREIAGGITNQFGDLVRVISASDKRGAYAMIRSDGELYGTASELEGDYYPTVGSMLDTHLSELAARLPFDPILHEKRYGSSSPPL